MIGGEHVDAWNRKWITIQDSKWGAELMVSRRSVSGVEWSR